MDYKFINTEYLDSVTGGDADLISEIANLFKEQIVEFYRDMVTLLGKKNYYALGLLAHKAKSSVAIMGMNDLALMLKNFELLAKDGKETEKYESFIERFKNDTREAAKELNNLVNNAKKSI